MEKIGAHLLRVISSEARCDPRSVKKLLRGERTHGTVMARLVPVLARHGIEVPPELVQPQG